MTGSKLKVTLVRSAIGRVAKQHRILSGLGLRRLHQSVLVSSTPEVRGMIKKIIHLVKVEASHE